MMKVIEIFDSIEGEGKRTGQTATFIRLAGCNLRCSYCDTLYSLFGEDEECEYTEMSIDEIISKVNPTYKRVTITGGEPLIHKDIDSLINKLSQIGYEINLETNGTVNPKQFTDLKNVFATIDYKLPSSGMSDKMNWDNFINLKNTDVIKFVIGSKEDIECMKNTVSELYDIYKEDDMPILYAGAVFGKIEPSEIVDEITNTEQLKNVVFQLQIHKFIWHPDERGV